MESMKMETCRMAEHYRERSLEVGGQCVVDDNPDVSQ